MAAKRDRLGLALKVVGIVFIVAALGVVLNLLGAMETSREYTAVDLVIYSAVGAALLYVGLRRSSHDGSHVVVDGPIETEGPSAPSGDVRRLTDHALDAADGLGVDTSAARAVLRDRDADETRDHLSAGGGDDDDPLLVAKMAGKTLNVRFWRLRGRPTFEIDLDVETGEVTFAKADGERLV